MAEDPIVEETHRVRRELAEEFNGDIHAFFEYLRKREHQRGGEVLTLPGVEPESERLPFHK